MKKVWLSVIVLLLLAILPASAFSEGAADITSQCNFWVSEGSVSAISDSSMKTEWTPSSGAEVRIALPENAGYVSIDWSNTPSEFIFMQYDASMEAIAATDQHESLVGISQLFHLNENARYVSLHLVQPGQSILRMQVYSKGTLPQSVKDFNPPYEKCDLMVVSAHQDDEWIFFGGIIPYYQYVRDKDVQVVYMANCGRTRKSEALNGLWAGGVRNHPEFIDLPDKNLKTLNEALDYWNGTDNIIGLLVERIRRFKPEVILTHDFNGEYGHKQHILTSTNMAAAIMAAADPNSYPDSYNKYGAWEVKKLYIHLSEDCEIDFDWNKSYDELYGYTPLQVARKAYAQHKSQQEFYQVNDGGKYDNSRFGLTYSTVGWDVRHDDLFENIDIIPEITAVPEPMETPAPTAEPTPEPTPQNIAPSEKRGGKGGVIALVLGGIVILSCAGILWHRHELKKRRRRRYKNQRYR